MNFKKTAIAVCAVCVALPMFARHRHHGGLFLAGGILNAAAATANIVNSSIYGPRTVYVNPPVVASPVVTSPVVTAPFVTTPVVETYYDAYPYASTYYCGGYYGGYRPRIVPPPPPPRVFHGGFRGGFHGGFRGGFRGGHHGGFRGGRHRR